jgi:hypothetical protein
VLGNVTLALGLAGSNGDDNKLSGLVKGSQFLEKLCNSCLLKDYTPQIHDKKAERYKTVLSLRTVLHRLGQEKLSSPTNSSVLGNIFRDSLKVTLTVYCVPVNKGRSVL